MKQNKVINFVRQRVIAGLIPEGNLGIKLLGHRFYVGGRWKEIGKLQFEYMLSEGMKPTDCFLDVGCGALRGGVQFINYLDSGNYLGIDKESRLIKIGIERELGEKLFELKKPQFVISSDFEFHKFQKKPKWALALSLFTHLNEQDIRRCLQNLKKFVDPGHAFYVSFFEGAENSNPTRSHSLDHFEYTRTRMECFGKACGWMPQYIGDWNHPRNHMLMRYISN